MLVTGSMASKDVMLGQSNETTTEILHQVTTPKLYIKAIAYPIEEAASSFNFLRSLFIYTPNRFSQQG